MSFITEIAKWVKGWRLDKFFKGLVNGDKKSAEELQATVAKAIELVNNVKAYLRSPMGDFVTAVIPGTWDSDLKAKAELFLTKVANSSASISDCVGMQTAGEQLVCSYNKIINVGDEAEEDNFWHKLGVFATMVFADGKITFGDAVVAAEFVYRLIVKEKKEAA